MDRVAINITMDYCHSQLTTHKEGGQSCNIYKDLQIILQEAFLGENVKLHIK